MKTRYFLEEGHSEMFGQTTQPTWFFDNSVHLEAVNRLLYLIESGEPLGIVCGPDGSGRTRVLSKLKEELSQSGTIVAALNLSGQDEESALRQLTDSLAARTRPEMRRFEILTLLRDELSGRAQCGVRTAILLDDIHRAADDMYTFLRILLSLNAACRGSLTVVVMTDKPLAAEFSGRSLVQVNLSSLDGGESSDFVRSLLRQNRVRMSAVDESAVQAVSEFADGNTARITRVCELLKVVHQTSPDTRITAETVGAVLSELAPDATRVSTSPAKVMRAS